MAGVGADVDALQFNRAVAKLYELVNAVEKAKPSASRHTAMDTIVRLVAPMMPHLAEEAWARLGREGLVADAPWPEADPALLVDDRCRSEEHTSELQSLMRISYAVFCLKKKRNEN